MKNIFNHNIGVTIHFLCVYNTAFKIDDITPRFVYIKLLHIDVERIGSYDRSL